MSDPEDFQERYDQFVNYSSGIGTVADDRSLTTFLSRRPYLDQTTLDELYKSNPIAKRIVNRPSEDATRQAFDIEDLDVNIDLKQVRSELESLDLMNWLQLGMRWSRLYGGALGFLAVDDKTPLHKPVQKHKVTKIRGLHIVDRFHARPIGTRFSLQKSGFMVPEQYEIQMPNGDRKTVHKSRTVRFEGVPLPIDMLSENEYWGLSELEAPYNDLRRLSVTRQYLENFVHEASVAVMKIDGLHNMTKAGAADGTAAQTKVAEALQNLRRQVSNFHWLGIDAKDDYSIQTKGTAGLMEFEKGFVDAVVMSSDMPRAVLLGETPGGLNSGENAGEIRSYYDAVSAMQERVLNPVLDSVVEMLFLAMHNRSRFAQETDATEIFVVPEQYTISWTPLWRMSEEQSSEQAAKDAATDKTLYDLGVVTAAEIRTARVIEGQTGPLQVTVNDFDDPVATGLTVPQMTMLMGLVEQVTAGLVPKSSAIELARLAVPSLALETAESLFAEAGTYGSVAAETAAAAESGALEGEGDEEIDPLEELMRMPDIPTVDPPPPDLMKAREIAERVGVSPSTIKTMARNRQIRYWQFGSQKRYSLSEVFAANQGPATLEDEDETEENTETMTIPEGSLGESLPPATDV